MGESETRERYKTRRRVWPFLDPPLYVISKQGAAVARAMRARASGREFLHERNRQLCGERACAQIFGGTCDGGCFVLLLAKWTVRCGAWSGLKWKSWRTGCYACVWRMIALARHLFLTLTHARRSALSLFPSLTSHSQHSFLALSSSHHTRCTQHKLRSSAVRPPRGAPARGRAPTSSAGPCWDRTSGAERLWRPG